MSYYLDTYVVVLPFMQINTLLKYVNGSVFVLTTIYIYDNIAN